MEKVTTKEAFLLAYWEAYPCDQILKIAEKINYQQAQKILAQGLADNLGTETDEDKDFAEFFGGKCEKDPVPLDAAIFDTHAHLGEMVAVDYIGHLSMDEAITLIRLLRRSPYLEFTLGGTDGITLRDDYIFSGWINTHRGCKDEFVSKLEEN